MAERLHAVPAPEGPQDPMAELMATLQRIESSVANSQAVNDARLARIEETIGITQPTAEMPVAGGSGDGGGIPADMPPSDAGQGPAPRNVRRTGGSGSGGGQPPVGGDRGGEGRDDNPNRRRRLMKAAKYAGVAILAASAAIIGTSLANWDRGNDANPAGGNNGGGKSAPEQVGPASKLGLNAGEYKRLAPVANNPKIDTVEEASRAYKGANFDQIAQDILSNPEAFKNVDISHYLGRYINSPKMDESISNTTAMEVKLIGIVQDEANARSAANQVQGINKAAERTDTHEEQIEIIRKYLLKPETKGKRIDLRGLWSNGTVNPRTLKVTGTPTNFSGEDALMFTDGKTRWIFKLDAESGEGNCFNDVDDIPEPKSPNTPPVTTGTPDTPPADTPEDTPRTGRTPKVDPDDTPAGVPARGPGTGTTPSGQRGPGRGPAGQAPDPQTGRVRGEAPVAAQPQEPTPAPLTGGSAEAPAVAVDGDGEAEVVNTNPAPAAPPVRVEAPAAEAPAATDTVAP